MIKKIFFTVFISFLFLSCEDVIEVELPSNKEKLIIDALIKIDNNLPNTAIKVKANLTSSFFDEIKTANLEKITISSEVNNWEEELTEEAPGLYSKIVATDILKQEELTLTISYDNQIYEAKTTYVSSVAIDNLTQGEGTLFNDDETEIIISYTDNPNMENFYLFDFNFGEFLVSEDTFYKGQLFEFSFFYDSALKVGQSVTISLLGIDKSFYNYMNQVIVQSGGNQGPFQTPASTVRGNIINTTEENSIQNYALGYFAICETFKKNITIE
mgnify:CR=1 FL=1|tara:strand:- start:2463 stop:3275 length:813 start_codon:yes stop_codon:yes gene_type:complete